MRKILTLLLVLLLSGTIQASAAPSQVRLSSGGRALQAVVTGEKASIRVRAVAAELAAYLKRISGAEFEVKEGDGLQGLAVGMPQDFPKLETGVSFQPQDPFGQEEYLLRTHADGAWLIGATETAVGHAVWDFLYRLGYRHFFPGETWEVVPRLPNISLALDTLQRPSFCSRRLRSLTYGLDDRFLYAEWRMHNRLYDGWQIASGETYERIILDNRREFEAHPEYRGMVSGKRGGSKFCISNSGLRKLVTEHALGYFRENPDAGSISMEPSDGGGWCECDKCAAMGSISDRVVILANEVAVAINKDRPGRYVGLLAYNRHSPPPAVRLHPQVVITVAAGYVFGGWRPEELFAAWGAHGGGGLPGVFEYYCNITSRSLPRGQRASDIPYLKKSITDFYNRGARRMLSGTAYGNGAVGLGAYMASRMLWDVNESGRTDELYKDFLDKCFPGVQKPMDGFYRLVYRMDEEDSPLPVVDISEDIVGRLYRQLDAALKMAVDKGVRRRIMDMVIYTRYTELSLAYNRAAKENRAAIYGDILKLAWRARERMVVNAYGLFAFGFGKGLMPDEAQWRVPPGKNPYKDETPIADDEIISFLKEGLTANAISDYTSVKYSQDLIPAAGPLGLAGQTASAQGFGQPVHGRQVFHTWIDKAPAKIRLKVRGGIDYPRFGNVRISLYRSLSGADAGAAGKVHPLSWISLVGDLGASVISINNVEPVSTALVPPDNEVHLVELETSYRGLHRIEIDDSGGATLVLPGDEGMAFTLPAGPEGTFINPNRAWNACFYVPKGTELISLHISNPGGRILDGDGKAVRVFTAEDRPGGYFNLPVPKGQDDRFWSLEGARGKWRLLNVPPYLAVRPEELLLPREIVLKDGKS